MLFIARFSEPKSLEFERRFEAVRSESRVILLLKRSSRAIAATCFDFVRSSPVDAIFDLPTDLCGTMTLSNPPKLTLSGLISCSLVSLLLAVGGCRASRPIGNLFQVTRHEQGDVIDGESPRQRLASTKQRAGSVFASDTEQETGPSNRQLASNSTSPNSTSPNNDRPLTRQVSYEEELDNSTRTARTPPDRSSAEPTEKLSDEELMAAFEGTSPEIKEQALRQLVAVLSRNAETTQQPASLTDAIEESVRQKYHLPKAKNQPPRQPLKRLAMDPESRGRSSHQTNRNKLAEPSENVVTESRPEQEDSAELGVAVVENFSDRKQESIGVRTVSANVPQNADTMVATAAIESPIDADSLSDQMLYQSLLKRVSTPVEGESEADRARRLITARHLMVLAGNPDAAVGKIDGMTDKEQEYLRHQLLGLWTMVDPEGHPVQSRRFSSALPQLREATRYLAAATDSLEVRALAFCTEILAYGQIKPFDRSVFKPNQQVILYCEVDNFVASKVDSGYQTHLQGSYDILNADNQKVASQLLPADQQVSSNYLRDYFIAYQMHLPQNLEAGEYRLQLTMEDIEGKKYGQSSIAFKIQP